MKIVYLARRYGTPSHRVEALRRLGIVTEGSAWPDKLSHLDDAPQAVCR